MPFYCVSLGNEGSVIYADEQSAKHATVGKPIARISVKPTWSAATAYMTKICRKGWQQRSPATLLQPSVEALRQQRIYQAARTAAAQASDGKTRAQRVYEAHSRKIKPAVDLSSRRQNRQQSPKPAEAAREKEEVVNLTQQQEQVIQSLLEECSAFVTGPAGSGKTVLLRALVSRLATLHDARSIAVTATTGIAASHIKGGTLHSWAGCGLAKGNAASLAKQVQADVEALARWKQTKVLIVDEVSMLSGDLFNRFEEVARIVRASVAPFGGIQVICFGDFYQLPPIASVPSAALCFFSCAWKSCISKVFVLNSIFRQQESTFLDLLNKIRIGQVDAGVASVLASLRRPVLYQDGIEPTTLFPLRHQVEAANQAKLDSIQERVNVFKARDTSGFNADTKRLFFPSSDKLRTHLNEHVIAESSLTIKKGAQVMLIRNMPTLSLVNGSLGKVIDFIGSDELEGQRFVQNQQATIHLDGLGAVTLTANSLVTGRLPNGRWPVVAFGKSLRVLLTPAEFEVQTPSGIVQASRLQVPLILSYSISIHKSQGLTLDRVRMDLSGCFAPGQAYVALSRATSLDRLELIDYSTTKITALQAVKNFYASL